VVRVPKTTRARAHWQLFGQAATEPPLNIQEQV
jgi:hypothetical protein